jgi:hypothetical protein
MAAPLAPLVATAYPPARRVAAHVHAHMARRLAAAPRGPLADPLAAQPGVDAITAVIDTAFWASLRREEGYAPRISLAFVPREHAPAPLSFARPIPLSPVTLARLAPAVERPGIHLGVWGEGGELAVWGTTRSIPRCCLVLEVVAPGLLVVKYRHDDEAGKFVNVAVLEGDEVKVLDQASARAPECPPVVASLLGLDLGGAPWGEAADVLVQLAVSMRAHGRGGTLLVVPDAGGGWRDSLVRSIPYAVEPPFTELADLVRQDARTRDQPAWLEASRRAVDAIAGLTAVDGATVVSGSFAVLAFGAKIARRRGSPQVEAVLATEPIEGSVATVLTPTQLGGTRHLSAAQFVHDQPDAVALVASQDGRFTAFSWAPGERLVRAHRLEALLL